jgi:RNA polymerase sigma factor (sigma-70 family)
MGRPEQALDPDGGPATQLAHDLRQLRQSAGLTYRQLAARAHYSHSALSRAAAGTRVPPWDLIKAFVSACGQNPADWWDRWRLYHSMSNDDEQGRTGPLVDVSIDVPDSPRAVAQALRALRRRSALEQNRPELSFRQIADNTNRSRSVIADYFSGTRLPPADTFDAIIQLLGATADEQRVLADARDDIEENLQAKHRDLVDGQQKPPSSAAVSQSTRTGSADDGLASFRAFYIDTVDQTFQLAWRTSSSNRALAQDATQSAYLTMFQRWNERSSKPRESNRGDVVAIAIRKVIDRRWQLLEEQRDRGAKEDGYAEVMGETDTQLPHFDVATGLDAILNRVTDRHFGHSMLNKVNLALLDGFECIYGDRSVLLPLESQRLLALLAFRRTGVHRTVAGQLLWHDSLPERAEANLRSALWRSRRLGNTTMIESIGPRLRLAPALDVDLHQMLDQHSDLTHPKPSCHNTNDHLALVDVLTRQLLPEWSEDWLALERGRWDEFRLRALENLARQLLTERRYLDALQTALAAASIEPIRETPHRIVIKVHLAEGNTASALKCYQHYRELLRRELGIEPSIRLNQLVSIVGSDESRGSVAQLNSTAGPAVVRNPGMAESSSVPARDYHYDETLVARAQAGDHDAFDQLYTRHYSYSWSVAYKMVFHRQDADDLAQAAWVKVYMGLHTFKPDAHFLPWLHGITVHVVIDHCRRQQRRPERLVDDVELFTALPSTTVPESTVDIVANEDIVRRALSHLRPYLYREVLVLADMIDMRTPDIAKQLGLSVSQVNGVLHRARKKFTILVARELDG